MRFAVILLLSIGVFLSSPILIHGKGASSLETISFRVESKDSEVIEIRLNDAIIPKIFKLDGEKPRLVLDFLDTIYKGKMKLPAEGGELVRGIRVGYHKKPKIKTRVVVDLNPGREIFWQQDSRSDDKALVLSIRGGGSTTASPLPVVLPPPNQKVNPDNGLEAASAEMAIEKQDTEQIESIDEQQEKASSEQDTLKDEESVQHDGPMLLNVSFDNVYAKSGEMVLFKLNDFHPPAVSAIEKGQPRIICDFLGARIDKEVPHEIKADGKLIEKIRLAHHQDPDKIRVVLDLQPGNDYDLQQVFFKEDNLFVLIVNTLQPEVAPTVQ